MVHFMKAGLTVLLITSLQTTLFSCSLEKIKKKIPALHYTVKSPVENVALSSWEQDSLGIRQKRAFRIKSVNPVKNSTSTWYRFTINEETFSDSIAARERIRKLFVKPPSLSGEQLKLFPLRRAFHCNNRVFVVTTDAALFKEELERLVRLLQNEIK